MSKTLSTALVIVLVVAVVGVSQAFYTVHQTQKAIVLMLGKPLPGVKAPGLHYKIPFVQSVVHFDVRVLEYDSQPKEILTEDKKAMVVDNYTKWRIRNPLTFYKTVNNVNQAQNRLDEIIYSNVREALGNYTLTQIVSKKRADIMSKVSIKSSEQSLPLGIEVLDVRIKRTDLPTENEMAIFGRMKAERQRQAKQYRSEGEEEAAKITSQADREKTVVLAEAQRQADVIRGIGDANATRIYADAYNKAPDFYSFQRSLQAYKISLESNTQLYLTPDNRFFRHIR